MAWPALYNGYPLLYPDSMTYLQDGPLVARALFLHKLSSYYGMRSLIYSLGVLPWHWNVTLWPVVLLQALLSAFVIWLVVRSLQPRRTVAVYLILIATLSLLTSLSWYASLIMPDFLGPVLYLCIYLLVFARESLSPGERVAVAVIAWWAVTSHSSHLILAVGLCILLASLLILRRQFMRGRLRAIGEVAMIVLLAAAAQLALNSYLYGAPSLNGDRPPYLTARIIADGPGRWYLQQHCPQANLAVCAYVRNLPDNVNDFLWGKKAIYQTASPATGRRFVQEEVPFVLATLRTYPQAELDRSAISSLRQLTIFGYSDLEANNWVLGEFDHVLPGERQDYLQSQQASNALPLKFFSRVQGCAVVVSIVLIIAFVPFVMRRQPRRLIGLSVTIVSMVVANAFVTASMAMVEDRLESRVIWLLPFLAGLFVLYWLDQRSLGKAAMNPEVHFNVREKDEYIRQVCPIRINKNLLRAPQEK